MNISYTYVTSWASAWTSQTQTTHFILPNLQLLPSLLDPVFYFLYVVLLVPVVIALYLPCMDVWMKKYHHCRQKHGTRIELFEKDITNKNRRLFKYLNVFGATIRKQERNRFRLLKAHLMWFWKMRKIITNQTYRR